MVHSYLVVSAILLTTSTSVVPIMTIVLNPVVSMVIHSQCAVTLLPCTAMKVRIMYMKNCVYLKLLIFTISLF